jgi:hypothetical protein
MKERVVIILEMTCFGAGGSLGDERWLIGDKNDVKED